MKKVPNPDDGQPTPDMPERRVRGGKQNPYAARMPATPLVYEYDDRSGITPDRAKPRPLKSPSRA